ncbi:MAG: TetR/AcrR family transcriptional regulator [Dehalococcoidia bacterium]|jgi:AcrR family transcriptional regulator|nr:TetR/AcrR family transcriptional regulator [Dehalococcoidia bacterium]
MTEAHIEARRNQIIEAARACFLERGFHATKIQDIAKVAGLSTGAPYRYFESKDDIVAAMCSEALDRHRRRFGTLDLAATSRSIFEELSTVYLAAAHEPGAKDTARLTLQVWEESTHSDNTGEALRADFNLIQTHVAEIVKQAQARGEIDNNLDPPSVAQTMVSLVLGLIVQRAAGVAVEVDKYEEATRSLVTGKLWNATAGEKQSTTNPT